ncbi:MAG TPA: SPFH domain-containing protein [Dehalococcoidia bacterium]|nr:SPFH domain-containing protein [Dehalococcoidia bacterium]
MVILVVLLIVLAVILVFGVLPSLRISQEWERKVVLRLGRFAGVRGPGVFILLPYIERTPFTIDMRTITSPLKAEQTLTKDGTSVTVDMIVFWRVVNPEWAAIRVANYASAVLGACQAGLRDVIGRTNLAELLSNRQQLDTYLAGLLDAQTEAWGVKVESVQLRDIQIPASLIDAMSRNAQAEREAAARVLLAESEKKVAQNFADAARIYETDRNGMQLRGMNMLYEVMKAGNGTVILVPSSALDSMNVGGLVSVASTAANGR